MERQRNPYVGPRTFTREESDLFFGREREARDLTALVEKEHLVVFYAPAGAGKSSLINTRLIPNLEARGYTVLPVGRVSGNLIDDHQIPDIYAYNLMVSLQQREPNPDVLARVNLIEFLARLNRDSTGFFFYPDAGPDVTVSMGMGRVLIIDQFEELFSTNESHWEEREDFFKQLIQVLQDDPRLRVVLVMRDEYIASLDPFEEILRSGSQARYSMRKLDSAAALEAITRPVESIRPFEGGAARRLVEDLGAIRVTRPDGTLQWAIGQYVEPVQLQVVCYNLWEILPPDGSVITERDLQDLGDVDKSLERYYDLRVSNVARAKGVPERKIREWFGERLINAGGIRVLIPQERGESGGLDNQVIQAFEPDLVHATQRNGATWYELTNDRLVKPILESNRRWSLENINPFQRQAAIWNEQGRNENLLLRDQAYADAEVWASEHQDELTALEMEFLASSRKVQTERQTGFGTPTVTVDAPNESQPEPKSEDLEPQESEEERNTRLRAAIAANILARNRAQAVYNDQAQGEDQLGIKEEVEALAETLLLRDVEPPVAVGIMGGWGSGKSFVMYLIGRYVEQTRAKAITKGWSDSPKDLEIPAYVGHIYQVSFNAWTYAKSNLWASLMDTIFTCLNRQMQLERLFAYQELEEKDLPKTGEDSDENEKERARFADQVRDGMLRGGPLFKKIYQEDYQIALDPDLSDEAKDRLTFWSDRLLSQNLLWQVLRNQNENALKIMRKDEQELEQYKARRAALEQARQAESVLPAELDDKVAKPAYYALLQTTLLGFVTDSFGSTIREELKNTDIQPGNLIVLEKKTRKLLEGPRGFFNASWRNRYYWLAALSVAVIAIVFPLLWNRFVLTPLSRTISYLVALVSAAAPFLPTLRDRWQKIVQFEVETRKAFESAYEAQRARKAEEIASANLPLDEKIKQLEEEIKRGSLPACDVLIRIKENQIEQQRRKIGPAAKYSNLLEFVQSRLDAATYENQLGLMHQVRQDIDELTYSLVSSANRDIFPRGKPRVILYIDDLDRCPPSRVVEILEAVQLLLNTKLFVVILGLDTRYVTRALEKEYKEILQHEGDPSGLDYIEKIIQIPYRVRPIERDSLQKYLAMQMDVEKTPEKKAEPAQDEPVQATPELLATQAPAIENIQAQTVEAGTPVPAGPENIGQQPSQTDEIVQIAGTPEPTAHTNVPEPPAVEEVHPQTDIAAPSAQPSTESSSEGKGEQPASVPEQNQPQPEEQKLPEDLPPAVVQFKQEDLIDLTACCQQVSLTPRSIKRVVNVFKLMKIFWFRSDKEAGLAERDRPRPVKQAAICLLALSSAYPEVMREVFVYLEGLYRNGQEHTRLFAALNNIKLPPGSAHELAWQFQSYKQDVSVLRSMPGDGWNSLDQLTLGELKFSTFNIVRSFSFVGDPVYWTDDEEKGRANGHVPARRAAKVNRN
jgi:hypothetical protein